MNIRLVLGLVTVAACADGGDEPSPPPEQAAPPAIAEAPAAAPAANADPLIASFDVGQNHHGLAFSANGERIFASDGPTTVWDIASGTVVTRLETNADRLATSRDGSELFAPGSPASAALWDTNTLQSRTTNAPGGSHGAFSPDASFVAVAGASLIPVWSVAGDSLIASVGRRFSEIALGVAVSPDGRTIAAGYMDKAVRLWNIADGTESATLTGHGQQVFTVAFSPDGSTLASGSGDGTIRLWDLSAMAERAVLTVGSGIREIEVSPDGQLLAAGSLDGAVRLWRMSTGAEVAGMQGDSRQVNAIAFNRDGSLLASVWQNGALMVWDVEAALATYSPLGPVLPAPAFYPTGALLDCDERGDGGGVIIGSVVDSVTNEPVERALVDEYYSCRVYTDSAGRFIIADVPPRQELSVGAQKTGYGGPRGSIDLAAGDTVYVELRMPRILPCDPASYPDLPRVETDGSEVRLRLPPTMTDVLDRVLPGFRPTRLDEIAGWMVSNYRLSCYQAPSAVVGDFNGDGLDDLAAFGFVGDYDAKSFVLLSDSGEYRYVERDMYVSSPFITTLARVEPGLQSEDPSAPALGTQAFRETFEEKGSTVYHALGGDLVMFPTGGH